MKSFVRRAGQIGIVLLCIPLFLVVLQAGKQFGKPFSMQEFQEMEKRRQEMQRDFDETSRKFNEVRSKIEKDFDRDFHRFGQFPW